MISPSSFKNAFLGIIPSTIMTASDEGIPNIAYLSQVYLLSERQIALTTQFFNKTKSNLLENPLCTVRVYDPETFAAYEISARYNRSESTGQTFEQLAKKFSAVADHVGSSHFFHLQAVEILDIMDVEYVHSEADSTAQEGQSSAHHSAIISFGSLQKVCERVSEAQNLEELFDSILQAMDLEFGLAHSMILVPEVNSKRLVTISTRGYNQNGVGAEVNFGEGVIGHAAEMQAPFVHASLTRELLYARSTSSLSDRLEDQNLFQNAIPLPGLKDSRCQVAVPIVLHKELLGVLFAESQNIFELRESDENILKTLSHFLGLAMSRLQLSHEADVEKASGQPRKPSSSNAQQGEKLVFTYFKNEDCLFLNGEYLIRNVPARILWKILKEYKEQKKTEYSNRELRMDPWLELPDVKDNLETRLILLRKRLGKKSPAVTMITTGRGRFHFEIRGDYTLIES